MAETKTIRAVDLVRGIRDEQAAALAGKSDAELMDFFRRAAEHMRALAAESGGQPAPPPSRTSE